MVAAALLNFYNIVLALLSAKMHLTIEIVNTLSDIIKSPVHSIEEKMGIKTIYSSVSHTALHTARP